MLPAITFAQIPPVGSCLIQDALYIEDDGPEKAIVTYYNSVESCSVPLTLTLTAPNGISVDVVITVGVDDQDREMIELYPTSGQFMSFPPDGKLLDGEIMKFTIMGGLS